MRYVFEGRDARDRLVRTHIQAPDVDTALEYLKPLYTEVYIRPCKSGWKETLIDTVEAWALFKQGRIPGQGWLMLAWVAIMFFGNLGSHGMQVTTFGGLGLLLVWIVYSCGAESLSQALWRKDDGRQSRRRTSGQ